VSGYLVSSSVVSHAGTGMTAGVPAQRGACEGTGITVGVSTQGRPVASGGGGWASEGMSLHQVLRGVGPREGATLESTGVDTCLVLRGVSPCGAFLQGATAFAVEVSGVGAHVVRVGTVVAALRVAVSIGTGDTASVSS